ncbi:MAG: WD40-repeat-containing domain protein [Monoraphidium minutum]|nr:MAG: WD40-repeat-containing domain protein [Monoraphidium minutum]
MASTQQGQQQDAVAGGRPVVRLEQARPKGAPQHGMCMALHAFEANGGAGAPQVVAGYEDGSVALWDVRAVGRPLAEARLHKEAVMCLALGPPASRGPIPAEVAGGTGEEGEAAAVSGSDSGGAAVERCWVGISGSADSALSFFSIDSAAGQLAQAGSQPLLSAGVGDAAVRTDGRVAATAHWDGRVRLWHARKRAPLGVLRYHSKAVAALALGSAASGRLASGARDGAVAVWSVFATGGGTGGGGGGAPD